MLYNFIGCPQSGKTTTAAALFASMKETGQVAEFSTERARFYIATKKITLKLRPEQQLQLSDQDQLEIMKQQVEHDEILVRACGPDVVIVSDSSPLNSMLYMTPEVMNSREVQELAYRSLNITSKGFYSMPLHNPYQPDPNRVHTREQSLEVDKKIPALLKRYPALKVITLYGTATERLLTAQTQVLTP